MARHPVRGSSSSNMCYRPIDRSPEEIDRDVSIFVMVDHEGTP